MTMVLHENEVGTASTIKLTPDEMVARCKALHVNEAFEVFVTEYDRHANRAERMSCQVAWRSTDECRELTLYRYDHVDQHGNVTHEQFLHHDLPYPIEMREFQAALIKLWQLGFEAGVAEGQAVHV